MRVAIDATDALVPRVTGTGVYVRRLAEALVGMAHDVEVTLLGIRSQAGGWNCPAPGRVRLLQSPAARSVWSQGRLPLHLLRERYDILHFVDHKLPPLFRGNAVVTIHDLAFEKFPEMFVPAHRRRLAWFTRDAIRRADGIIAVSQATKADLCELFDTDPARIAVIPHGVDPVTFHPGVPPLRRPNPYILAVGALHPRKNYTMLMRAFRRVCREFVQPLDLIIVGQRAWMWEDIESEARRPPFQDRIHLEGFVGDADLPSYYAGARLLVQPSLYEGFGIPVLEAMACGTPVVASRVSALPEVIGNSGRLLDPRDEDAWVAALLELLHDPDASRELAAAGAARAREFSWSRAASATLQFYRGSFHG